MEDFAWASLYKNQQIEDHFENKVWECYSVPYRYAKKNILKSKPKRQNPKIKNKSKNSKVGKKMLQKGPSISHISSRNHSDSDYEDNIPLQIVQEGLNTMSGESPICGRMRIKKHLHIVEVIRCETQRELWDLDNYEAFAPETEHKVVRKPEYSSLGMQPFSPISNEKQICEVLVASQFNKDKSTIKVDKGQKMTEVTRTSTPKNKVSLDCTIELSPIQNSVQTPNYSSTRNTQHHHSVSRYDWVKLNRKFSNCAT